jgi:hypothetical protein
MPRDGCAHCQRRRGGNRPGSRYAPFIVSWPRQCAGKACRDGYLGISAQNRRDPVRIGVAHGEDVPPAHGQTGGIMNLRTSVAMVAVVSFAGIGVAEADWLGDAWSGESSTRHGSPSITIGAAGEVSVALPGAVLQEAHAAGATTEGALRAFLGKYGPRLCSQLLDLNIPQKNLKVELRMLGTPFEGSRCLSVPQNTAILFSTTRLRIPSAA